MNKKTAKALKVCIARYEKAAVADDATLLTYKFTGDECALCALHFCPKNHPCLHVCDTCPVRIRVGRGGCQGTPWAGDRNAQRLRLRSGFSYAPRYHLSEVMSRLQRNEYTGVNAKIVLDHVRERCEQEAEFLKSLRE